jgi:hypothetical protein
MLQQDVTSNSILSLVIYNLFNFIQLKLYVTLYNIKMSKFMKNDIIISLCLKQNVTAACYHGIDT